MKDKILEFINKKQKVSTSQLALTFQLTPQGIHKHLKKLLQEGTILKQGTSRKTSYYIPHNTSSLISQNSGLESKFRNINLQEDKILKQFEQTTPFLRNLPENTAHILYFSFTEMLNNAIDHSHSKTISIRWNNQENKISFEIEDKGIGIFSNIQKKKKLSSDLEAIQDLLKGKETTQPEKHSGEGIFFTSKIADLFFIDSHRKRLTFNNTLPDIFIQDIRNKKGTLVHFEITRNTLKKLENVFQEYTNEDFEFEKTQVKVSLYKQGIVYISRSQAKRLLHGLIRFKKIILDFQGVETVGQGFADEIFRVFQNQHPEIEISPIHMHENVEFMVKRAKANSM